MQVCIIYDGDYPWDVRIEKMTATLVNNGYQVHLICRNLNKKPIYELFNKIHIHRLAPFASNFVNQWTSFPAFFNPAWLSKIRQVIKTFSIGLIIVRDLPLALAATMIGKAYGLTVILDMAENYPAMLRDVWKFDSFSLSNIVLRNPVLARGVESIAIRMVDHFLVVIDEAKERLVGRGVRPEKISIVSNTPRVNGFKYLAGCQDRDRQGPALSLIFVGGLEPMRGLDAVLEMLPTSLRRIPSLRFTIVGSGRWERDLKKKTYALGLDAHVVFAGRNDYKRALFEISRSDIGIIPHRVTTHTNSTIPNKLFEYMLFGKPVIATEIAPVSRIIREVDCGMTYSDDKGFVSALLALEDPRIRTKLGENGRRAVLEKYNWNYDSQVLIETIKDMGFPSA